MHSKNQGFTLIELLIVIVILGILAVIAIPKFLDIATDARLAKLYTLESALITATNLVSLKAQLEDKTDCATDPTIDLGGTQITLRCGYPCPHPSGIGNAITQADGFEWYGGNCAGQLGNIDARILDAPDPENCKIRYVSARSTREPEINLTINGC